MSTIPDNIGDPTREIRNADLPIAPRHHVDGLRSYHQSALYLSAAALAVTLSAFVFLIVHHVAYPGFLEPMEGDVLQHIQRVCRGEAIYATPSSDFIPLSYMPLYYVLSAPLYCAFGDGFGGPRLLSALCAIASGALCFWIVRRESRSTIAACVTGALFFSSYRIMDAALTVALPDSLLLLWLLLGFCFLAFGTSRLHDIAWLVCFTLAFWTKQHGALFFGCAVVYAITFRDNHISRKAILAGILLGGPGLYFTLGPFLGPGFYETTLLMPGSWDRSVFSAVTRTAFVIIEFIPFLSILTVIYLCSRLNVEGCRLTPLAWFCITSIPVTAFTMLAAGAANNHYIPLITFFAIASGISLQPLAQMVNWDRVGRGLMAIVVTASIATWFSIQRYPDHPVPIFVPLISATVLLGFVFVRMASNDGHSIRRNTPILAGFLVAGQLAVASYNPFEQVEGQGAYAAITDFQSEMQRIEGDLVWAEYGYVPVELIGRETVPTPSMVALEDIERQRGRPRQAVSGVAPFRDQLRDAKTLYVISNRPLDETPGWNNLLIDWEFIRDYGTRFVEVKQVTRRWFGGGAYPRFLYRKASVPLPHG